MKSSSIPPNEAHLYTTRAESGLIWSGFISIVLFVYYLGISAVERSFAFAWPLLAVAVGFATVATVFFYVCRAQRMFLQPGSPDYIGKSPASSE